MVGFRALASVVNALTSRAAAARWFRRFGANNDKRDYYDVLGYLDTISYNDYWVKYLRQDIAKRIIQCFPKDTWGQPPEVYETETPEETTAFESAWERLVLSQKVWHQFEKLDRLCGLGRYAVMLVGMRGGSDLTRPLRRGVLSGPDDVLFLQPYSEESARISEWEMDPGNPRFGLPKVYTITATSQEGRPTMPLRVHHSRVIHVAEDTHEDPVYGTPRLQAVFNRLDDLEKVVGGCAEMFWKGADRIIQFNLDKDMELFDEDKEEFQAEIDKVVHGMKRHLQTRGVEAKPIGADVADPEPVVKQIAALVSAATDIPQQVLFGLPGETGSKEDRRRYGSRITLRQQQFGEPVMLRPFIDMLQFAGALPQVEYHVRWTDLMALTSEEKVERAEAMGRAVRNMSRVVELAIRYGTKPLMSGPEIRKLLELDPEGPTGEIEFVRPPMDASLLQPRPGEQTQEQVGAPQVNQELIERFVDLMEDMRGR